MKTKEELQDMLESYKKLKANYQVYFRNEALDYNFFRCKEIISKIAHASYTIELLEEILKD